MSTMPPDAFMECTHKLFEEFYPDVRMFVSDLCKDICNKLPKENNPYFDGILTTVILSCLCKEMAVVLSPISEELVDEMVARMILCITAWIPEMREEMKQYLEKERENI